MRISKSKFVAGVQCLKRLYLQVHEPGIAAEMGDARRAVIEQGRQVGVVAQKAFPGGVTVTGGPGELDVALKGTQELVAKPAVPAVFEATFQYEDVLVRADVLQRAGRSAYRLIEVKSSTHLKPHYLYDIAIQRHVLEGAGVDVERASLMYLNREYVFDGTEYAVSGLFTIEDIEGREAIGKTEISGRLKEQFRILNQSKPPDIKAGPQCDDPFRCEFYERCNTEIPADHVSFLPRMSSKKVEALLAEGITSIHQIPDTFELTERQRRAMDCVKSGKLFIGPELRTELDNLKYPLCFMDFETVFPALPRFAGMAPYDHIPFQWSVHRQEKPGAVPKHFEFLADDNSDPRLQFVESLCKAVDGAGNIVVYNETFEFSRLDDLDRWLPRYAKAIQEIKDKMWDLLIAVRHNVYHPDFGGSFSLKSVLPAFLPEMTYDTLEISEGTAAGLAWQRFIAPTTPVDEKRQLKPALLAYCKQDTLALMKLLEVLRKSL